MTDTATLQEVLTTHGMPGALYTNRAHCAVHPPTSGSAPERRQLTQVGRALPGWAASTS